jgi:hypothetical protein
VTYAGGHDLHERLALLRVIELHVFDGERSCPLVQNGCLHFMPSFVSGLLSLYQRDRHLNLPEPFNDITGLP